MLFQIVLDITVDRQHQRIAVRCGDVLLGLRGHINALCILQTHHPSRRAGKLIVILHFQPSRAVIFAVDITQHRGQKCAVLIIPLGIRFRIYAGAARFFQLGI